MYGIYNFAFAGASINAGGYKEPARANTYKRARNQYLDMGVEVGKTKLPPAPHPKI